MVMVCGGWYLVRLAPGLGATGPWIAGTVHIMVTGVAYRWRFKSNKWRKIDIFKLSDGQFENLELRNQN